jgi:hypothetical protein
MTRFWRVLLGLLLDRWPARRQDQTRLEVLKALLKP